MAFPTSVGVLAGRAAISETLRHAPRWASVSMTDRAVGRPDADTLVLGHGAEGIRHGGPPYAAFCTSTHSRRPDGRWALVQHAQVPAA